MNVINLQGLTGKTVLAHMQIEKKIHLGEMDIPQTDIIMTWENLPPFPCPPTTPISFRNNNGSAIISSQYTGGRDSFSRKKVTQDAHVMSMSKQYMDDDVTLHKCLVPTQQISYTCKILASGMIKYSPFAQWLENH